MLESASDCFLFPLGIVTYPGVEAAKRISGDIQALLFECIYATFNKRCASRGESFDRFLCPGTPILIYKNLRREDGWKHSEKPPAQCYRLFLDKVLQSIDYLLRARLVLLDLRFSNILWREKVTGGAEPDVEIQIIDFEDIVSVGLAIPALFVAVANEDGRYPLFPKSGIVTGQPMFNFWWYICLVRWFSYTGESGYDEFVRIHCTTLRDDFSAFIESAGEKAIIHDADLLVFLKQTFPMTM